MKSARKSQAGHQKIDNRFPSDEIIKKRKNEEVESEPEDIDEDKEDSEDSTEDDSNEDEMESRGTKKVLINSV